MEPADVASDFAGILFSEDVNVAKASVESSFAKMLMWKNFPRNFIS